METLSGKLLIASPDRTQSDQGRSVIYLFQDSPEGTVGVTLNQPANESVQEVWNEIAQGRNLENSRLSIGGPLSGPVLAVHGIEDLGDLRFSNEIFAAATQANLKQLIAQEVQPYRVFFGLTGWKKGVLEQEINSGVWLTAEPKTEHILGEYDDLWCELLSEQSTKFLKNVIRAKHIPSTIYQN